MGIVTATLGWAAGGGRNVGVGGVWHATNAKQIKRKVCSANWCQQSARGPTHTQIHTHRQSTQQSRRNANKTLTNLDECSECNALSCHAWRGAFILWKEVVRIERRQTVNVLPLAVQNKEYAKVFGFRIGRKFKLTTGWRWWHN